MFMLSSPGAAADTFPYIADSTSGFTDSVVSSFTATMPSGAQTGDLLVVISCWSAAGVSSSSSGWTKKYDSASGTPGQSCFVGISGTAASSLVVTNASGGHVAWISLAIRNWSGVLAEVFNGTVANSISTTPDPPSLAPAAGTKNYLWLALTSCEANPTVSAAPSGYSGLAFARCSSTLASPHHVVAYAWKKNAASSENPGTFTIGASNFYEAQTVAVMGPKPNTITAVGSFNTATVTGATTLTVDAPVVDRIRVLVANVGTNTLNSVSGGGVGTWARAKSQTANGQTTEVWWGKITSGSGTTLTLTWNTSVAGLYTDYSSQMFQSSLATPAWAVDVSNSSNSASGTSLTFPSLSPTFYQSQLYVGAALVATTSVAGSTPGYDYHVTANSNMVLWNPTVQAASSPTCTQTGSGFHNQIGVIFRD